MIVTLICPTATIAKKEPIKQQLSGISHAATLPFKITDTSIHKTHPSTTSSIHPSNHLSTHPSTHPSIRPSIYTPTHSSTHQPTSIPHATVSLAPEPQCVPYLHHICPLERGIWIADMECHVSGVQQREAIGGVQMLTWGKLRRTMALTQSPTPLLRKGWGLKYGGRLARQERHQESTAWRLSIGFSAQ